MIWEKREEAELLSLLFLWKPLIHLVNMLHLPSGQQQVIQERYLIIVLFLLTMISYFPMAAEYHTATLKTYPAQHIFSNQCKFIWIDSGWQLLILRFWHRSKLSKSLSYFFFFYLRNTFSLMNSDLDLESGGEERDEVGFTLRHHSGPSSPSNAGVKPEKIWRGLKFLA